MQMGEFLQKNRKMVMWVLVVVGALLILAGLLADTIGVGATPGVFGTRQIAAVVVGVVLLGAGIFLGRG